MGSAPAGTDARSPRRRRAILAILLAGVVLVVLAVVNMLFGGPPRPSRTLVPEVVGIVIRQDFVVDRCQVTRVTLEGGRTLDLVLLGDARAKCGDGPWQTGIPSLTSSDASIGTSQPGDLIPDGGILYYGHDGATDWIAGAWSNGNTEPAPCPYRLSGTGYDEGDVLHFSTGLVIRKTSDYQNRSPWMDEKTTFRDADRICVNRHGDAIAIWRWSPI